MKSNIVRLNLILAATAITALSQACSSGSLPSNMNEQSSTSAAATATAPLLVYAGSPSILVGGTSTIAVVGGAAPFSFSLSTVGFGSLSASTLAAEGSVTFTGVAAGSTIITVTDQLGATKTATVLVNAATPTISAATRALYLYSLDYSDISNVNMIKSGVYHKITDSNVTPSGWTPLGVALYVYINQVTGSVPLLQCVDGAGQTFESLSATCEGFVVSKTLGYVYPPTATNVAGTSPLNRYAQMYNDTYLYDDGNTFEFRKWPTGHVDHLTTIYPALNASYPSEGVIAYAPSALAQ